MKSFFLTNNEVSKKEYKRMMKRIVKVICSSFNSDTAYSGPTPDELKKIIHLECMLPKKGLGFENVLSLVSKKILPNMLRPSSTKYMPHLHSPALLESLAAEAIISVYNQSMDSWDQAPVATEIEIEVINNLCKMYGFDESSDGIFTSGGSQSNQTAIILARDWFCNSVLKYDVKKKGLPKNFSKLIMYTSEISHFSMEKSAHILGLGYESVVKVPVNSMKKMDISNLKMLIEKDISDGNIPFMVVATVGTTDFGSIDSLLDISEICNKYNIWLHADAAYGSGVIMSQKYKNRVDGLNLCDSITVDFHKMFLLPISCSAVLIKDAKDFDALTIHADYLNREEDEEDGYTNLVDKSLQTTRRFDALKVWVSFLCRGQEQWSEIITKCIDNAYYLYSKLKDNKNFYIVVVPEISSVVFRFICDKSPLIEDELNKKVRRILMHKHGIVVGQTIVDGRVCLKFTLLNPLCSYKTLDELIEIIQRESINCISEF